mgnify:CR=1 FL=1
MKKIYGYIVGIVVGLIIIIWFVIFITGYYKTKHNKNNINLENYTQATDSTYPADEDINESFYLVYEDGKVVIYKESDRTFYDYADINMNSIPAEIREQLKLGLYIDGEENLYNFLQVPWPLWHIPWLFPLINPQNNIL